MGKQSLNKIVASAHRKNKGVIALCHMSAPEAKFSYELNVKLHSNKEKRLYQLFLEWAISQNADGIIVGATYPKIIRYCKKKIKNSLAIYSPGIGTQGGKVKDIMSAGSDYLIVGRTILNANDPVAAAKNLQLQSFNK